jgi:hypothetical protein
MRPRRVAKDRVQPTRRLEPIVDSKCQIVFWKCSACCWTAPVPEDFSGLAPSRTTEEAFAHHICTDHLKATATSL